MADPVSLGITIALTAANMALTMSRKIEGPRLDDTKFTGGDYGASLPMVWGLRRLEVPIFWAEDLREVKQRRKTKGGKYNDYTYYGTWAVALAGHEISSVRRIWFDTHLVYDLSGAGPVTPFDFGAGTSGAFSDYVAIYTGTSTQEPDPRMDAWCTARYGEGSCPAYRDTAYVVFKDIPVEKVGNRIPQVSVEIVTAPTAGYPIDYAPGEVYGTDGSRWFSPDYALLLLSGGGDFSVYDVAARQQIITGTAPWHPNDAIIRDTGNVLAVVSDNLNEYDIAGNFLTQLFDFPGSVGNLLAVVYDGAGTEHRLVGPPAVDGTSYVDEVAYSLTTLIGKTGHFGGLFTDLDGNVWGVAKQNTGATEIHFYRFVTVASALPATITITGLPSNTGQGFGPACHYRDASVDHFVFQWGEDLYAADPLTATITASQTAIEQDTILDASLLNLPVGSPTIWVGHEEFSLADLTKVRGIDASDWSAEFNAVTFAGVYDPVNHALSAGSSDELAQAWLYLDRVGGAGVALSQIAADVADMCGVEDYDFTDLDQLVTGWSATRGAAANMLEPLLDAFDSDIRPHNFTIEGIRRTGATAGATLLTERFVGEPRYAVKVQQASELPRALLFDFADVDAEQQPNSVRSDRPLDATAALGEKKLDLTTLALTVDDARNLGDRYFRRLWNERKQFTLALTAQNLGLEPGDVRTLSLDGDTLTARCISMTVGADDVLATEWRYDHPSLAVLANGTGAGFDGRDEQTIAVPLLSKGFVLDIPLLSDADAATTPALYVAVAPYATGTWPGAVVYQGIDGEFSEELATVASTAQATWGYAATALPYANPNLWDRGTSLTVTLQAGELTGCTEAAADANPLLNLAAIGAAGRWEVVQFTGATLVSGKTYTLSGFKRGRRGTEWAAELHAASDQFLLLDTADAAALGLSDVSTNMAFKAITVGRTEAGAAQIPIEPFTGATLKPYAPAHFTADKQSSGDWLFSWTRRTRVGGAWTGGAAIPLSEASEEYTLIVGDGVTSATKAPTSPTYTWAVADQITDTGAEVLAGDLVASVAQVSDAVGAGFVSELTA